VDAFLALSTDDRRDACREAEARLRLGAASIEKDFWVCWTLRELFALPGIGEHLTFKGGTSLSKCWQLIERFSEDLDITVHRASLGFGGDQSPDAITATNQRNRQLQALHDACCAWVADTLAPAITRRVRECVEGGRVTPDPVDPMSLLVEYPSAFSSGEYLRPHAKIELGARSDVDPAEMPAVRPYLAEALPSLLGHSTFDVRALSPKRTFWEKAMLLHEESYRPRGPKVRLARHYYDLWCLIRAGVAEQALADTDLFDRIATHRAIFFRKSRAAQQTLRRGSLRLMPNHFDLWQQDYDAMREHMFFGDVPQFLEIVDVIEQFQNAFNQS
jgi:hypothetical protein